MVSATTRQFSYDTLNRLKLAQGGGLYENYIYDDFGNLKQSGNFSFLPAAFNTANQPLPNTDWPYDLAGNLLADGLGNTFTWDANGMISSSNGTSYDAEGNITSVDSGSTAQYVYNALNQRVRAVAGSAATEYVFNAAGQRVSEWNGTTRAQFKGKYYWGVAPVAYYAGGAAHFEHQDWLGTERMRTAYNGGVEGSYTSLPFGDGQGTSGADGDANHYATLDHDAETATDHAQFRQYSEAQGRWLSPDPYSGSYDGLNPQSFNRYTYVMNSPLAMIDPLGLWFSCSWVWQSNMIWSRGQRVDEGTTVLSCTDYGGGGGSSAGGAGGAGGGGGGSSAGAPNSGCFSPNWLQKKGIALQQKAAQKIGHPFGFGAGISAGAGFGKLFGFAGTASAQMVVSPNGNAFLVYTYGGSGLTTPWLTLQTKGLGVTGGLQVSSMTTQNPSDLAGLSVDASAGGGDGLGGGGDISYSGVTQGTLTGGFGAGGFGGAGVITKTTVIPSCSNQQ